MFNIKITKGSRRFVLLIAGYAIKIPRFTSWEGFICGIMENVTERYWYCGDNTVYKWKDEYPLAKIYWADRFGFIMIMKRCIVLTEELEEQYKDQIASVREWCKSMPFYSDIEYRIANLGLDNDRVVVIDYGYFDGNTMYLFNPVNFKYSKKDGKVKPTLRCKIIRYFRKLKTSFISKGK